MGKLTGVKLILDRETVINNDVYCQLLNEAPAGMMCKLRLVPDYSLASKLAHLLTVANIEAEIEQIGIPYKCLSVEGISEQKFYFDHDAIVRNELTNALILIDCTADSNLIASKSKKLSEIKSFNSEIDSVYVHLFRPKKFLINVTLPGNLTGFSAPVFTALDKISLKSNGWKDKFFMMCQKLYEEVTQSAADSNSDFLDSKYDKWTYSGNIIDKSITLVTSHNNNDMVNFKDVAERTPTIIFYDTLVKILSNQRSITPPLYHRPCSLNSSRELSSVLLALSANPIAKCLYYATLNPNKWTGVDLDNNVDNDVDIRSVQHRNITIGDLSKYKVVAKQNKEHIFSIKFSSSVMDDNFYEQLTGTKKTDKVKQCYNADPIKAYEQIFSDYTTIIGELSEMGSARANNTILGKMSTLSALYNEQSPSVTSKCTGVITNIVNILESRFFGEIINHDYEVAKTFAASLKQSPGNDQFYVGVNGPFQSVNIIKMNSTQDSFTTSAYFVIYQQTVNRQFKSVKEVFTVNNNIVQSKTRSFNKNTLTHSLKMPYVLISLILWECEHLSSVDMFIKGRHLFTMCTNSLLHVSVNSDQFAQCAEQIRYLFTSNVGLGASPAAICSKIDFIKVRSMWELIYIGRMLKLSAGLNIIFKTGHIKQIIDDKEFVVMFPNNVMPIKSFSYTVSCMYYANIYNKFRAFHEVSEAICYNELDVENKIYLQRVADNITEVHGITHESLDVINNDKYVDFNTMYDRELQLCHSIMQAGPGRFRMSLIFIIGATLKHMDMTDSNIKEIYNSLAASPIDACTMHGAMESGVSKRDKQGIRSASAMFEELLDQSHNDSSTVNRNSFMGSKLFHDFSNKSFDFSVLSGVSRQYKFKDYYRYRIVQKDQKGHREISVLNSKFRLGALMCERIAHTVADIIPEDLLDNPNKDTILENKIRTLMSDKSSEFVLSDNSDQKRWGPNHLLHSFSAMFLVILKNDVGLYRTVNMSLLYGENKYAKLPENLIDLGFKTGFKSRSEPIVQFFNNHASHMRTNKFEEKFEWGMCQGIYHRVSSLYHGLMCKVVSDTCNKVHDFPKHELYSFVTSDDAERLFNIKDPVLNRVELCKKIHLVINNIGSVMNILRNESKSVFSSHITEFNSIFYHNGILATPTLKQRISKLDIGDGHDPHLDYLTAMSMSMGYFQNGGSYMGAVIIMFLNVVLHTEQWNRWSMALPDRFARPVEFGGFPVLEPFTAMYCGPISSMFLKSIKYADSINFSHLVASSTLVSAVPVNLLDFSRTDDHSVNDTDIRIFKSAGPLGIISKYRTDRRLSKFERRHHMSKWVIPDDCITLNKTDSDAGKFLFNLIKITLSCEYETNLGVNSFHIRFTDPWVNKDRKCLHLHNNSLFTKFLFPASVNTSVSPTEFNNKLNSLSDEQIQDFYDRIAVDLATNDYPEKIRSRIEIIMEDAGKLYTSLSAIGEPVCNVIKSKNFIVKVNLQKDVMIDEDYFYFSLLKSVIGLPVKDAIERYVGSSDIWDKLDVIQGMETKPAAEGMFHCGNIVELYNRFIKKTTKLICPGDSVPNNLSELFEKILKYKFTEVYGLKNVHLPELRAGQIPSAAYRACNNDLIQESIAFWINHEKYIDRTITAAPVKLNVISEADVITHFDSFITTNAPASRKTVEIKTKGKFNFINRLKMWLAGNVYIKLHEITLNSLVNNNLTYLHEYAISNNLFIKNQTGLQTILTYDTQQLYEIQYCTITADRTHYTHHYFTTKQTSVVSPTAEHAHNGKNKKKWADKIVTYINRNRMFNVETEYHIYDEQNRNITDTIVFHTLNSQDQWELITYDNNLTIFLSHLRTNVLIPVCAQQLTRMENYNLNINYTPADLVNGMLLFSEIDARLYDKTDVDAVDKQVIQMLLFRSCFSTTPSFINKLLVRAKYDSTFISEEAVDFCRALILSNLVKKIKGNRVRIQHFFLNLFRSSPYYNNGMTSVEFDEVLLKDEELELNTTEGMDDDVIDLNVPDVPAWSVKDKFYNDLLITGLDSISEESKGKTIITGESSSSASQAPEHAPVLIQDATLLQSVDDIFAQGICDDDDMFFEIADDEGFQRDYEEILAADIATVPEPNMTRNVMNIPVDMSIYSHLKDPIIETSTSHVVNKHFEECFGIIDSLKSIGKASKADKRLPRSFTGDIETLSGTLANLSNKAADNPTKTVDLLNVMYKNNIKIMSLRVPMSAICIAEQNFE